MIAMSRTGAAMGRLLSRLSFVAGLLLVASPAVSQSLPSGNPATPEQVRFYHSDALGSVRAVTDIDGEIVSRSDYLPFGEQIPEDRGRGDIAGYSENDDAGNKQRFTGKERDNESGLDFFGARYHSGAAGRFTSADPLLNVRAGLVDPQHWNRYAIVGNNPLARIDPTGRDWYHVGGFAAGIATGYLKLLAATTPGSPVMVANSINAMANPRQTLNNIKFVAQSYLHAGEAVDQYRRCRWQLRTQATALPLARCFGENTVVVAATLASGRLAARQAPVFSGHGLYDPANGMVTVPTGTTVTLPTALGNSISDAYGGAIESGASLGAFGDEMVGAQTYWLAARFEFDSLSTRGARDSWKSDDGDGTNEFGGAAEAELGTRSMVGMLQHQRVSLGPLR